MPLHIQLQQVFNLINLAKQLNEEYTKYRLIVEWHSQKQKTELRFLTIYDLTDSGELSFHSYFNKNMFFGNVNLNQNLSNIKRETSEKER